MADYKAGNLSVEFFGIDKSLSGTLQDITNRLEKLEKVTSNLCKSGNQANKDSFFSKFNLAFVYGKIRTITGAMVRMGRYAQKILQYGVDYTETLNLWQVAMGDNLSMAQEFVTQMNRAYGISEKTLMNAQAIFKNMIGSLGQISDTMAYNLSEAITQMAIDYASLYNVSIDAAITKFQAALAGQVRPIRSVSGYDITENTLYQLYKSIGGTKTMRQLSRTEKQLLSIYAIFQQMGASGALGDMEKTIDQVANQTRMMAENWEQLATWAGVSLQYVLQEYNVFKYINAALIFASELLKSIAYSLGYETPDFANSWADNVNNTEEAIEELQGKLLDFDKFRSLSGAEENVLGIDTKLMEAISGYTTNIGNATNEARKLAEQWMEATFWTKESNGELKFSEEKFNAWKNSLSNILTIVKTIFYFLTANKLYNSISALTLGFKDTKGAFNWKKFGIVALVAGLIQAYTTNEKFRESINNLLISLKPAFTILTDIFASVINVASKVLTPIINLVAGIVDLANKLGILDEIIYAILAYKVYTKLFAFFALIKNNSLMIAVFGAALKAKVLDVFHKLPKAIGLAHNGLLKFYSTSQGLALGLSVLTAGIAMFISSLDQMGSTAKWLVPTLAVLLGVISGIAVAKAAAAAGIAAPIQAGITAAALVAGLALVAGTAISVNKFANGGMPDKGTMFIAGEAGAEMVYNTPSGQSGVANIEQIQQAMYGAMVAYGRTQGGSGDQPIVVQIDGEKVFQATKKNAKRHGYAFAKV